MMLRKMVVRLLGEMLGIGVIMLLFVALFSVGRSVHAGAARPEPSISDVMQELRSLRAAVERQCPSPPAKGTKKW